MILTCPNCSMRYSASAAAIGPAGRKVRCASCAHNWQVDASGNALDAIEQPQSEPPKAVEPTPEPEPKEQPVLADAPTPEPEKKRDPKVVQAVRARREAEKNRARRIRSMAIWGGIAASFVILFGAAWIMRVDVVRIWPKSASAYAMLGGHVNYYGLEVQKVSAIRKMQSGANILQVSGEIVNIENRTRPVPLLSAQLLDAHNEVVFQWVIDTGQSELAKDETVPFVTEVRDPPPGDLNLDIGFAEETGEIVEQQAAH